MDGKGGAEGGGMKVLKAACLPLNRCLGVGSAGVMSTVCLPTVERPWCPSTWV